MRVDGLISPEIMNIMQKADLSNVQIGDILKARVIAMLSDKILLQLMDGSMLSADSSSDKEYTKGMLLELTVKENNSGQLMVEAKDTGISKAGVQDMKNEMLRLEIPDNPQNRQIIEEIIKADIKPQPELIQKIVQFIKDNPKVPIPQALFIAQNEMLDKPELTSFISKMVEGHFHIQDKLENLGLQLVHNDDQNFIINLAQKLDKMDAINELKPNNPLTHEITEKLNVILKTSGLDVGLKIVGDNVVNLLNTAIEGGKDPVQFLFEHFPQFESEIKILSQKPDVIGQITKDIINILEDIPKSEIKTLPQAKEAIKSSLEKLSVRVLVTEKSEKAVEKLNVEKIYESMDRVLKVVQKELEKHPVQMASDVRELVQELQTSIRFSQEILSYETFAQLPIKINNQKLTGELYVMKNKKRRGKINPNDFTLFLSLNTESLGQIDALVHVVNKNVVLSLRMEDDKLFPLAMKFHKTLYEGLQEYGYKLADLKCDLIDENINILNAAQKAAGIMEKYNRQVDIKI